MLESSEIDTVCEDENLCNNDVNRTVILSRKPLLTMPNTVTVGKLPPIESFKVYKVRWLILSIFVIYSASNAMQWIQYSIISKVITNYYQVPNVYVDLTSMIFMILYIPFIFPGSYILEKLGLRTSIIIGMVGTCLGSWIKVASVSPDKFWIGFCGQSVVALAQVFILSVPARLAAVWFGPEQVSSACSIGVFGNQLGVAVGFLLPPIFVPGNGEDSVQTGHDLRIMFLTLAIFTSILLVVILLFFKDAPPMPPSLAQLHAIEQESNSIDFIQSIKRLFLNRPYMLLLTAYGINTGIFYAISTLLEQIILFNYPQAGQDAGRIGLLIVFSGMIGSVVCGVLLDKFHRFKETTLVVYACSLLGMIVYTFCLNKGLAVVYFVSALLGFSMTGLLPVGFELAAELTYPEPEGTSAGLLNAASQIYGIIFTFLYSYLFRTFDDKWANIAMSGMLLVGTICTACIRSDLRRQAAQTKEIRIEE